MSYRGEEILEYIKSESLPSRGEEQLRIEDCNITLRYAAAPDPVVLSDLKRILFCQNYAPKICNNGKNMR